MPQRRIALLLLHLDEELAQLGTLVVGPLRPHPLGCGELRAHVTLHILRARIGHRRADEQELLAAPRGRLLYLSLLTAHVVRRGPRRAVGFGLPFAVELHRCDDLFHGILRAPRGLEGARKQGIRLVEDQPPYPVWPAPRADRNGWGGDQDVGVDIGVVFHERRDADPDGGSYSVYRVSRLFAKLAVRLEEQRLLATGLKPSGVRAALAAALRKHHVYNREGVRKRFAASRLGEDHGVAPREDGLKRLALHRRGLLKPEARQDGLHGGSEAERGEAERARRRRPAGAAQRCSRDGAEPRRRRSHVVGGLGGRGKAAGT